jgi:hypothetical protein
MGLNRPNAGQRQRPTALQKGPVSGWSVRESSYGKVRTFESSRARELLCAEGVPGLKAKSRSGLAKCSTNSLLVRAEVSAGLSGVAFSSIVRSKGCK